MRDIQITINSPYTALSKIAEKILADNQLSGSYVIDYQTASKAKIKLLNKKFRNINKATDVLSFPIFSNLNEIKQWQKTCRYPTLLGQIVFCPEMVENKNSQRALFAHGLNHLLGFHH